MPDRYRHPEHIAAMLCPGCNEPLGQRLTLIHYWPGTVDTDQQIWHVACFDASPTAEYHRQAHTPVMKVKLVSQDLVGIVKGAEFAVRSRPGELVTVLENNAENVVFERP